MDVSDSEGKNGSQEKLESIIIKDLDEILNSQMKELDFDEYCDGKLNELLTYAAKEEKKAKDIAKSFQECEEQLQKFTEQIGASTNQNQVASGDDSDDDVQFVETTFLPQARQKGFVSRTPGNQFRAIAPNMQGMGMQRQPVPLRHMHPGPPKMIELALGMKLYGKKFNDIWYKGTLVDIHGKDKPRNERKYKLKFDRKGLKVLTGKHIAYADSPTTMQPVGSRVVAVYKEEDSTSTNSYYAGIVAESPSVRNNSRYLVFFDDGYAQYCFSHEIHKVCEQSKNVWEDIHPDSQEFIKSYLKQYPERPMVRLQSGQVVKTEWNGKWWTARVQLVDASLVKMFFDSDKRVEWIYRGSTRLEPLYTELANAEASKAAGRRRHNVNVKSNKKPFVEYTRGIEDLEAKRQANNALNSKTPPQSDSLPGKKRPVARKSTAMKEKQNTVKSMPDYHRPQTKDMAGELQERLQKREMISEYQERYHYDPYERMEVDSPSLTFAKSRKKIVPHKCGKQCVTSEKEILPKLKGNNPLTFPIHCSWERQISRQKSSGRRTVFYRSPCGRRLRSIEEVDKYLLMTDSQLTIDLFCFDAVLHTTSEFKPIKTFCDIKDLSYGKENVPISCVNGIDRQYPDYVEYSNVRTPAKGVDLNLDPNFLACCDCTDGCRDKSKCQCWQATFEATAVVSGGKINTDVGYENRRLPEQLLSGIYECNSRCKCDQRCHNRVAQNPLSLRLQVFKTEKRGWGLRCLDDIPAGGFICVYAGQLLTEQGANEDGQQFGDEYLAELDYIEVVEKHKEGYESDVNEDLGYGNDSDQYEEDQMEESEDPQDDSDSDFSGEHFGSRKPTSPRTKKKINKLVIKRDATIPQQQAWTVRQTPFTMHQDRQNTAQMRTAEWVKKSQAPSEAIVILSSDEDDNLPARSGGGDGPSLKKNIQQVDGPGDDSDSSLDSIGEKKLDKPKSSQSSTPTTLKLNLKSQSPSTTPNKEETTVKDLSSDLKAHISGRRPIRVPRVERRSLGSRSSSCSEEEEEEDKEGNKSPEKQAEDSLGGLVITEPTSLNTDQIEVDEDDEDDDDEEDNSSNNQRREENQIDTAAGAGPSSKRTTRSQTSRFKSLPDPKSKQAISPLKIKLSTMEIQQEEEKDDNQGDGSSHEKNKFTPMRDLFSDHDIYVMDAKSMGNLGRYLNHCCNPNVFVQSVFVDTHDLRFPWVAFFASQYIRAGTELTWDYNYEVGSVPGKVLYCYCGAAECRGRLL